MRKAALVAILAVAVAGTATPALADDSVPSLRPTSIKGFKETVRTTTDGKRLRNKARVVGGTPRTVQIQFSSDGSLWQTVRTRKTDSRGRLRFVVKVAPDRNRWRLSVPATDRNRAAISAVKTFAVQERVSTEQEVAIPPITAGQIAASKAYARAYILATYGWGDDQWFALEQLWTRESGWNHLAVNSSSGATGIPQALPGDKMATFGADWRTNPQTQIRWGASYIKGRYGDPLGAWAHFEDVNWY